MRIVTVLVAACTAVLLSTPLVNADPGTTSRLSWVTNGDVRAAVAVGGTLYIGGTFSRVAPASSALGSLFSVSTSTGEPTATLPLIDGTVHAIEPDGAGGYYIGGAFTTVGGAPRANLAHVLPGGAVDPAFAPNVTGGPVTTLARGSAALFVGGAFTSIDGGGRDGFAALNATSGAVIALPPTAFADASKVRKLLIAGSTLIIMGPRRFIGTAATAFNHTTGALVWETRLGSPLSFGAEVNDALVSGSRLIIAGRAVNIDGASLVSLDVGTGATTSWSPGHFRAALGEAAVTAMTASGGTLYVGGRFTVVRDQARENVVAIDIATGGITGWAPNPNGAVSSIAVSPGGTVFLGGTFAHVAGQAREKLAEVDESGAATPWTSNARAGAVRTLHAEAGGTLMVGGHVAVAGGSARTNLAAFDLSTNTLLPWAPATEDDIQELAAAGGSIFVGSLRAVPTPTLQMATTFALDAVSGATLPWTPPHADNHVWLQGTHDGRVYLTVIVDGFIRLVRVDSVTGALDESWRPAGVNAGLMAVSGNTMYAASGSVLRAIDLTTGSVLPWSPQFLPPYPVPNAVRIRGLAVDGRTVYAAIELNGPSIAGVLAFDAVTGLRTGGGTAVPFLEGSMGAIAVADGQLLVSRSASLWRSMPPLGAGVAAYSANGAQAPWNPRYSLIDIGRESPPSEIVVTPTDIIVLGHQATVPVPVQGIAVLPRTPSLAPKSLRATTAGQEVTLTWDAPATPPGAGYIADVASEPGSPTPLSVPTGSQATTLTGVVGNGTYYVRVRAAGAPTGAASLPTNEIGVIVGCDGPPPVPTNLAAQVSGGQVTISWTPSPGATRYVLEAATALASTIFSTFPLGASPSSVTGAVRLGIGHFVRLRAGNACGTSDATTVVSFIVGEPLPPAPTGLTAQVNGSTVTVQWTAAPGAIDYEVTAQAGTVQLARFMTSATGFSVNNVPVGTYHLSVRSRNTSGLGLSGTGTTIFVK